MKASKLSEIITQMNQYLIDNLLVNRSPTSPLKSYFELPTSQITSPAFYLIFKVQNYQNDPPNSAYWFVNKIFFKLKSSWKHDRVRFLWLKAASHRKYQEEFFLPQALRIQNPLGKVIHSKTKGKIHFTHLRFGPYANHPHMVFYLSTELTPLTMCKMT